jgi:UDP-3-O-[3-hydroxymyristoyl] glucosamine N-acyltransferase
VVIGENCLIHPNVAIYDNTIINNVVIHAEQFLALMPFITKRAGFDKLLSGGE